MQMNRKGWLRLLGGLIIIFFFVVSAFVTLAFLSPFLKNIKSSLEEQNNQSSPSSQTQTLPAPLGEKIVPFNWKYGGKNYTMDEKLYESYYQSYNALPTALSTGTRMNKEWYENQNEMFVTPLNGDTTIKDLAQKIRTLGEEKKLNENQIVEFISTFVQTIPYDQNKLDRRTSEMESITEKITYPYEVLYDNTGVCQDKSYLAYALLKELGYGISIFLFPNPEDNHMAVGVKCPLEFSNYNSGYCFVETTSLGNKIGMIPELIPKSRVATSNVQINTIESNGAEDAAYQPLGNVEILNKVDGKEYTGIINTINTQKELERLKNSIAVYKRNLKVQKTDIDNQEVDLAKMEKRLNNYKQDGEYEKYNNLVPEFNTALSKVQKTIKEYNKMISASNTLITTYQNISKNFYL